MQHNPHATTAREQPTGKFLADVQKVEYTNTRSDVPCVTREKLYRRMCEYHPYEKEADTTNRAYVPL